MKAWIGLAAVLPLLAVGCVRALGRSTSPVGDSSPLRADAPCSGGDQAVDRQPAEWQSSVDRPPVDARRADFRGFADRPPGAETGCAPLRSCSGLCVNVLSDPNHCGGCGGACAAPACVQPACLSGKCAGAALPDGTPCPSGTCRQGACCTGCWDAVPAACQPGTTTAACGKGGGPCLVCGGATPFCVGGGCA